MAKYNDFKYLYIYLRNNEMYQYIRLQTEIDQKLTFNVQIGLSF